VASLHYRSWCGGLDGVLVCVRERERERECVCERERESERERERDRESQDHVVEAWIMPW